MKKLLLVALLALGSISAHAALLGAPFLPEIDCRFNALETGFISPGCIGSVGPSLKSGGIFGIVPENIYKADVVIAGDVAGSYNTSIVLPPYVQIEQAWIYNKTAVAPSGTTTALKCLSTGDILAAADETGVSAGATFSGVETGTAATMLNTGSAGCTVVLTTAVHTATAGEWTVALRVVPAL